MIICIPVPPYTFFSMFLRPLLGQKRCRDGDTFTATAPYRQFLVALLFADLPSLYAPLHFMNYFYTCSTHFPFGAVKLERQGAPKMLICAYITHACAIAKTAPLLSKPRDKSNGVFSRTVLAALRFIPSVF